MRLFTAFELPPEVRRELLRIQHDLRELPFKRWSPEATLHLTLHFLGEVPPETIPPLAADLARACRTHPPIRLALSGIGAFPSLHRPRTLWLGLGGDLEALHDLEQALRPLVQAQGIPLESRRYTPHLTLARDPDRPEPIPPVAPAPVEWQASELVLFRSQLDPRGAIHTPLERFPLGTAAEPRPGE